MGAIGKRHTSYNEHKVNPKRRAEMKDIATFSIVAYDPEQHAWGVAVQSKFLAAAAVVSWAAAGAGAVATQSYANLTYGPRGLALMKGGISAQEAIDQLIAEDEDRAQRQVGMVDKHGQAAAFTGDECIDWARHIVDDGYACQGNILVPGTLEAMAERFEEQRGGDGELADWLVEALAAGQDAGGDKRGRQAAGVLVVKEGGGYGGNNDRYLDLRVDDHSRPIQKLKKLVDMHHLYFGEVDPENLIPLDEVADVLQRIIQESGHYQGDITLPFDERGKKALDRLIGQENLEERWDPDGDQIDSEIVGFLREKYLNG